MHSAGSRQRCGSDDQEHEDGTLFDLHASPFEHTEETFVALESLARYLGVLPPESHISATKSLRIRPRIEIGRFDTLKEHEHPGDNVRHGVHGERRGSLVIALRKELYCDVFVSKKGGEPVPASQPSHANVPTLTTLRDERSPRFSVLVPGVNAGPVRWS